MDTVDPLRFICSFVFVISLLGLMAFGLKRWGNAQKLFGQQWFTSQTTGGRIEILETRFVDPRRRLVLVRRDDVEHLLLLADGRELVIESGIASKATP